MKLSSPGRSGLPPPGKAPAAPGRPLLPARRAPAAPAAGTACGLQALQPQKARTGPAAPGRAPAPPRRAGKRFGFLSSPRSAPRQPINAQFPPPASHSASQSASAMRLRQSERSCQRRGGAGGETARAAPAPRPLTGRRLPPPRSARVTAHSPGRPAPRPPPPPPGARAVSGPAVGRREEGGGGRPEQSERSAAEKQDGGWSVRRRGGGSAPFPGPLLRAGA